MDDKIKELLDQFEQQKDAVKGLLQGLLEMLDLSVVPSNEHLDQLTAGCTSLNGIYDDIYKDAERCMPEEDMPSYGTSVIDLIHTLEESLQKRAEAQFNALQDAIRKFLSVRSQVEAYAQALLPYQQEAQTLLDTAKLEQTAQIAAQTEPIQLFLRAMETEDIHCAEGLELMMQVIEHYPEEEIQYGLVGGQYRSDPNAGDLRDILQLQTAQEEMPEEPALPEYLPVTSQAQTKAPDIPAFRKDLEQMAKTDKRQIEILLLFTNFGVMDGIQTDRFYDFGVLSGRREDRGQGISDALDALVGAGLVVSIGDYPYHDLYCLSDYCSICMHDKSIRSYLKRFREISFGDVDISATEQLDRKTADMFFLQNEYLLSYLEVAEEMLPAYQYTWAMASPKWQGDHYTFKTASREGI